MMTLGYFPYMSLQDARKQRDEAKASLIDGQDPNEIKLMNKGKAIEKNSKLNVEKESGATFSEVFDMLSRVRTKQHGKNKPEWSESTYRTHLKRLNSHVFPYFGNDPIETITEEDVQNRLEQIQELGILETRDKVFVLLKQVFKYAKSKKIIAINPMTEVTKDLFVKKTTHNHKHVTTPSELKQALGMIDCLKGHYILVSCIQLSIHIFLRASEIVALEWNDVDFESRIITAKTTKTAETNEPKELLIPISTHVEAKLREVYKSTGHTQYVFKSPVAIGPISSGSINKNIRDNGLNKFMTHHGMRHTASTFLNEKGFNSDDIELQLNHKLGGVRGVYNKAQRIEQRRVMMQAWSDYLHNLVLS